MALAVISVALAAFIGVTAWRDWWLIELTIVVPVLVGLQFRRALAWAVGFAYFAGGSWDLVSVYATFTGQPTLQGVLPWIMANLILTMPLTLAWTENRTALAWRMPLALLFAAVPPIGLIGWVSPLTAAGVLFPGTAWIGLSVAAVAPGFILNRPRTTVFAGVLLSLVSWMTFRPTNAGASWHALNTSFVPNRTSELSAADRLQFAIRSSGARVTVFPESIVNRWTEATDVFWEATTAALNRGHRLAIVGAGIPIPQSTDYLNAAMVIGGPTHRAFVQRVPAPVGMWRPFTGGPTVPLRLQGPATMEVAGERVAFLICYEQLLVWPILQSAIEHPTLIVGMANQYWVRHTNIPAAQRASMKAWARLFALPLLISENR